MKQPDPYFRELIEKHFGGKGKVMVLEEINVYLKDIDDIASDSSIIFNVFNTFKATPWQGNYRDTFKLAISSAVKFYPGGNEEACEKFIIASLAKFALKCKQDQLEGLGKDHYLLEVDDALEYDRYIKTHGKPPKPTKPIKQ